MPRMKSDLTTPSMLLVRSCLALLVEIYVKLDVRQDGRAFIILFVLVAKNGERLGTASAPALNLVPLHEMGSCEKTVGQRL